MRPISEEDVQCAITNVLVSDAEAVSATIAALEVPGFTAENKVSLVSVQRSVYARDGETDVELDLVNDGHERLRVLIEVKLTAHFQPLQGRRYARRAERQAVEGLIVRTALIAPDAYLKATNPEAIWFDFRVPLEDFVAACTPAAPADAVAVMRDAVARLSVGAALGARGLFSEIYNAVARECEVRGNELRILNRPTAWMSLKHPTLPTGVNLNYRIPAAVAELRVLSSFGGDRARLVRPVGAGEVVRSGGEVFLRLPPLTLTEGARRGHPTASDVIEVVNAFEKLLKWWSRVSCDAPPESASV